MRRVLLVTPPGHTLPPWLAVREANGNARRFNWSPGTALHSELGRYDAVVLAGWEDPASLLAVLAGEALHAMEPAPLQVGLVETSPPKNSSPGVDCHMIGGKGDPESDLALWLREQSARRASNLRLLLAATAGLLLVSAMLGAGLITLWTAGYDSALQQGLMLVDGLEGVHPRLIYGESLQALHERIDGIDAWSPDSVASGEIARRVAKARAVLAQWLMPLDEAASWPEVEDLGTLERLEKLAERVGRFHPTIARFSDAPLGREALALKEEILQAAADGARQIKLTQQRIGTRRELLAMANYRSTGEPDWSGWHSDSAKLLDETVEVAEDSPVMALRDVRRAVFSERESILDLSRARKIVELLGLAGPGPALLVPPETGADAVLAAHRMSVIQENETHPLADFNVEGLPTVFVTAIRTRVDRCRAGWLAGGGRQVLELIQPVDGGITAWREAVGKGRGLPVVSGWDQLVGLLNVMKEKQADHPPLEGLERYLKTSFQGLPMRSAFVESSEMPSAGLVLVIENMARPGEIVRMVLSNVEKRNGSWLTTFRSNPEAKLAWMPGEACLARLVHRDNVLATWRGATRQVVGTEGIWGKSAFGIPAQLRWPPDTIPEPPGWFVESIR